MSDRPPVKASGSVCDLCGSALMNVNGWPTENDEGCRGSYHDGGYGSYPEPGWCGKFLSRWLPRPAGAL